MAARINGLNSRKTRGKQFLVPHKTRPHPVGENGAKCSVKLRTVRGRRITPKMLQPPIKPGNTCSLSYQSPFLRRPCFNATSQALLAGHNTVFNSIKLLLEPLKIPENAKNSSSSATYITIRPCSVTAPKVGCSSILIEELTWLFAPPFLNSLIAQRSPLHFYIDFQKRHLQTRSQTGTRNSPH